MTSTWEIADEDISIIVACHRGTATVEAARAAINETRVVETVSRFSDFADQVAAASCSIEDQLMETGVIPSTAKRYEMPVTVC